jgi:hypothetical protein
VTLYVKVGLDAELLVGVRDLLTLLPVIYAKELNHVNAPNRRKRCLQRINNLLIGFKPVNTLFYKLSEALIYIE